MREGPGEPLERTERDERDEEYGELEQQPDWHPGHGDGDPDGHYFRELDRRWM